MEIYNEQMELIEDPDLSLGWLENTVRIEHHAEVEAVPEVWHYEVIAEYQNGGKDVVRVIDVPGVEAQDAWDEKIPIQIYHPFTQEELEAIEAEKNRPTQEQRIAALEKENAYLKETLEIILSGATEEDDDESVEETGV